MAIRLSLATANAFCRPHPKKQGTPIKSDASSYINIWCCCCGYVDSEDEDSDDGDDKDGRLQLLMLMTNLLNQHTSWLHTVVSDVETKETNIDERS